jgi:hypothetical protein
MLPFWIASPSARNDGEGVTAARDGAREWTGAMRSFFTFLATAWLPSAALASAPPFTPLPSVPDYVATVLSNNEARYGDRGLTNTVV